MKKFIFLLISIFSISFATIASAEVIEAENQVSYTIYFGRGSDENAVNVSNFYTFINKEFASIAASGLTIIESRGQRYLDSVSVLRENTTIVQIVGDTSINDKIKEVSEKYCKQFKAQNVSVFVVKTNNVSTAIYN